MRKERKIRKGKFVNIQRKERSNGREFSKKKRLKNVQKKERKKEEDEKIWKLFLIPKMVEKEKKSSKDGIKTACGWSNKFYDVSIT